MLLLSAGFAMGLLGSPHCLGMCGGIVSAFGISMRDVPSHKKAWLIATYHTGRLISYMALGAVAATVGATVLAPFMTNNSLPRMLLGFAIIFAALLMLGLPVLKNIEKLGLGLWAKLAPVRTKVFPLTTLPKAMGAGLLWGLLPCGLVYGAIGVAVATGANGEPASIGTGMLFMLAFGLGTLPMLVATQTVVGVLQRTIKKFSLRKASGVLMLLSGLFVAIPAMTHNHHGHHNHNHGNHSHNESSHNAQSHTKHNHTEHNHSEHQAHTEQAHPNHNHLEHNHPNHNENTDLSRHHSDKTNEHKHSH